MESGAGGDRALLRKTSKSRLAKQDEIEAEEPPSQPSKAIEKQVSIPETRVESFELVESGKGAKMLVRSHAMCGDDDTKLSTRGIEKQTSSKSGSAASSLSRDSSSELYTDSTGINLEDFIVKTLHKNAKDRTMLLHLEEELIKFANLTIQVHRFPPMSSYNRMLVHRVAAFFGMDHNVDQAGSAVVVTKTQTSRIPEVKFDDYINGDRFTEEPKKSLKRDVQSYEEVVPNLLDPDPERRKARSFEDGGAQRMYNQDSTSSMDVIESPISYSTSGYSSDNVHVHTGSNSLGDNGPGRPWSSTDSGSMEGTAPQRQPLTSNKAGSFAGVSAMYRTSVDHNIRPPNRRSNTTDVGMCPVARQPCIPEGSVVPSPQQVVFAVASVDQVPPGAVILNPNGGGLPYGAQYVPYDGMSALSLQPGTSPMSYSPRSYSPNMYYMMPQNTVESQSFVVHVPSYMPHSVPYQGQPQQPYIQANDTAPAQVTYSPAPSLAYAGGPSVTATAGTASPLYIMLQSGQSTPSEASLAPMAIASNGETPGSTEYSGALTGKTF